LLASPALRKLIASIYAHVTGQQGGFMSQSTCPHCGGPLPIAAVRCPHCAGAVGQTIPPAGFADSNQGPNPAERIWTVTDAGRQFGPYTEVEMAMLFAAGSISINAMAWKPGSPRWIPITAVVPTPGMVPPGVMNYASAPPAVNQGVTIPILISAIFHLLAAAPFALPTFGLLSIALILLAAFEIRFFATASRLPPRQFANSARTLAIWEIISIVTCNFPSMICGIIVLANIPKDPYSPQ